MPKNLARDSVLSALALLLFLGLAACGRDGSGPGPRPLAAGDKQAFSADGISFSMVFVPGGLTSPDGFDDSGASSVADAYWIGETEVTYELWSAVCSWATDPARGAAVYAFANAGVKGSDGAPGKTGLHPATAMNWRDAIVFCNALTEWCDARQGAAYDCVYYSDAGYSAPIRDATDGAYGAAANYAEGSSDNPYVKADAKGFRLPSAAEWVVAARYVDGASWNYGDHASGDLSGACYSHTPILGGQSVSTAAGDYVVDGENSGGGTLPVGSRLPNALGIRDMSGNVWEYNSATWTNGGMYPAHLYHQVRGGGWDQPLSTPSCGYWQSVGDYDVAFTYGEDSANGFRLGRSR